MDKPLHQFDLYLLPVCMDNGNEENAARGVFTAAPPRRAEHSRSGDLLVAMLAFHGRELPPAYLLESLNRSAQAYYTARGSLSAGLRAAIDRLNDAFTARSARERNEPPVLASLSLAVLRKDQLFLAQVGQAHTYVFKPGWVDHFFDPPVEGQADVGGLGAAAKVSPRFFQTQVGSGDILMLLPVLPEEWNDDGLTGQARPSLELLRRRLMACNQSEFQALVVQLQTGAGAFHRLKPRSAGSPSASEPYRPPAELRTPPVTLSAETPPADPGSTGVQESFESGQSPARAEPAGFSTAEDEAPIEVENWPVRRATETALPETFEEPPAERRTLPALEDTQPDREEPESVPSAGNLPPATPPAMNARRERAGRNPARQQTAKPVEKPPRPQRTGPSPLRLSLARFWKRSRAAGAKLDQSSKDFAGRLLPEGGVQGLNASNLLFIAVAVPIIVVAVAFTIYLYAPGGRSRQHQTYLDQALTAAQSVRTEGDPILQRDGWNRVIHWLDEADEYGQSADSRVLRQEAQTVLDEMDRVERFNLRPANPEGFVTGTQITRIAATNTDVYLLDSSQGQVHRMFLAGQGYEVDPNFVCSSQLFPAANMGELLNIYTIPPNNEYKATMMGVDSNGNLLFCGPGQPPSAVSLPVPDTGWGRITHSAYIQNRLYVLDVLNNRVWFFGSDPETGTYSAAPRPFFDDQVPTLNDIMDMAYYNEDLFLLHANGSMTRCTFRPVEGTQTVCSEPGYTDPRPGKSGDTAAFTEANLTGMTVTQPFEPSLYLLDRGNRTIYHLGLQLTLQRLLKPSTDPLYPLPDSDFSGFTVTSDLRVFVAFGNHVYYANLP